MIQCRVLLFARARELAGVAELAMTFSECARVADVRRDLAARFPALAALLPRCAVAINGEYADDAAPMPADAELAIIPPVSGG